jgi:hypothetical protein
MGLNSVYLPRKVDDTTHSVLYLKDQLRNAAISFTLYYGISRVKSFKDEPLTAFPYDEKAGRYILSTGSYKFYFPKQKVWDVVLKVSGDKYRLYPEKNKIRFVYLKRKTENIVVDFTIVESRSRTRHYQNIPIELLRFDEKTGFHVIDKKFLKEHSRSGVYTLR